MKWFLCFIFIFLPLTLHAKNKKTMLPASHIMAPLLGKKVVVEGLLWGKFAKGLGERVLLPSGLKIYLRGNLLGKRYPQGHLAKLYGKLSIRKVRAVSGKEQGYGHSFSYYSLQVTRLKTIKKISGYHAFPRLQKKK